MNNTFLQLQQKFSEVKIKCEKYMQDSKYVYKFCKSAKATEWLVIMKKIESTITNEDRINIFGNKCDKFRANVLQVVKIISIHNPNKSIRKLLHISDHGPITFYQKNKQIIPNKYDPCIENICTNGIHYYRSFE